MRRRRGAECHIALLLATDPHSSALSIFRAKYFPPLFCAVLYVGGISPYVGPPLLHSAFVIRSTFSPMNLTASLWLRHVHWRGLVRFQRVTATVCSLGHVWLNSVVGVALKVARNRIFHLRTSCIWKRLLGHSSRPLDLKKCSSWCVPWELCPFRRRAPFDVCFTLVLTVSIVYFTKATSLEMSLCWHPPWQKFIDLSNDGFLRPIASPCKSLHVASRDQFIFWGLSILYEPSRAECVACCTVWRSI